FLSESVDAVFNADARIILGQHRGRYANEANPPVRGSGSITGGIQYRPAAYSCNIRMTIQIGRIDSLVQAGYNIRIILGLLSPGNDLQLLLRFEITAIKTGITHDIFRQFWMMFHDSGIDHKQDLAGYFGRSFFYDCRKQWIAVIKQS